MFECGLEVTPDKMETQNKKQKKGKMKTHDSYSMSQHIRESGQWFPQEMNRRRRQICLSGSVYQMINSKKEK